MCYAMRNFFRLMKNIMVESLQEKSGLRPQSQQQVLAV